MAIVWANDMPVCPKSGFYLTIYLLNDLTLRVY